MSSCCQASSCICLLSLVAVTHTHTHCSPVRPKLELLKTCVAAIPRIMPEGMTREDLLEVLSRFTIHYDFHLVTTALASLQNIITNFPAWRHDVTRIFSRFILRDIPDSCPLILDSALKMLLQMISHWKTLITTEAQVRALQLWSSVLLILEWVWP